MQRTRRDEGQILVVFALFAVVLVALAGLVLDGGGTFVQRRGQQNASDLAALAGANAWITDTDVNTRNASAIAAAQAVATNNGYTDGVNGQAVVVTLAVLGAGESVKVDVTAPHANGFAGIVGQPTWSVSTTATAAVGPGGGAQGSAPVMFSVDAFPGNNASAIYRDPAHPYVFGDGNGDYPNDPGDIAWTDFGSPANVNTSVVRNIINGSDQLTRTFGFGDYIGQHNEGNHSALFGDVDQYLSGHDVVAPVVDDAGRFQGWTMFHVVSAQQGAKKLTGYFVTGFSENLDLCMTAGACVNTYGGYVLKLIN